MRFSKPLWFSRREPLVAVEISQSGVMALKVSSIENTWYVHNMGQLSLAQEVFDGFVIRDERLLSIIIYELFSLLSIQDTNVAISLPDEAVISKMIQVSNGLSDYEIEYLIQLEAEKYLPIPLDDLSFDFQVLPDYQNSELRNVWLVATRKENIESRIRAFAMANLNVKVVELESNVLRQLLSYLKLTQDKIMLFDIEADLTKQYVFDNGSLIHIDVEESFRSGRNNHNNYYPVSDLHGSCDDQAIDQKFLVNIITQIRSMFENFNATRKLEKLDAIYLLGRVSCCPDLLEELQALFDIKVELLNPVTQISTIDQTLKHEINHKFSAWAGLFTLAIRPYDTPGLLKLS